MAKDLPVKLDKSAQSSEHPYLSIDVYADKDMEPVYRLQVFSEHSGERLYDIHVRDVLDRSSIVMRLAMELAIDPNFGFGRDGRPYRWLSNRWVECSKWFGGVGLALFAIIRAAGTRTGAESFEGLTESAWRVRSTYDVTGLDLSAFGKCPGIPLLDGVLVPELRAPDTPTMTDSNGVVSEVLAVESWRQVEHSPKHQNLRVLNITADDVMDGLARLDHHSYDNSLLAKFLHTSLTPAQAETVQRWFGYHLVLTKVPNADVMLYLHGDGGNGKSQILHLIRGLLGSDAVAEVRLSDLKIQANLEKLAGAMAMLGSEATPDTELELLKALISREPLSCNPKYRDPYTIHPECLVTQASNKPPYFDTRDNAMKRRVRSLKMDQAHGHKPIRDIAQRIIDEEFPLLTAWALKGAMKVLSAGAFIAPDEIVAESDAEVLAGNPMNEFLEILEFGSYEVAHLELRCVYLEWCRVNGYRALTQQYYKVELERLLRENTKHWASLRGDHRYKVSRWTRNGRIEAVREPWGKKAPSRPYLYLGFRVSEEFAGEPIGQVMPFRREAVALGIPCGPAEA